MAAGWEAAAPEAGWAKVGIEEGARAEAGAREAARAVARAAARGPAERRRYKSYLQARTLGTEFALY